MSHYNFGTPGHVRLQVDNKSGDVRVRARPGMTTEVEVTGVGSLGADLEAATRVEHRESDDASGHTVVIEVPNPTRLLRPSSWNASVTVRIDVPDGADIEISTAAGDIAAEGAYGEARLNTASGDITVGDTSGDLNANAASGEIRARSVGGKAELSTASGDIDCEVLHGPARARTASGDVTIKKAHSHVSAQTASGDVRLGELQDGCHVQTASGDQELERAVSGRARLHTMSGDLRVGVPRGTSVAVEAETMTGNLSSEIDLSQEQPSAAGDAVAAGTEGDGQGRSLQVNARTVTGDLTITRVP